MNGLEKQKQTVVFKCPSGCYCNYKPTPKDERAMRVGRRPAMSFGGPKKAVKVDYCRFCTKIQEGVFTCVLHNEALVVEGGWMPKKTRQCRMHRHQVIEDVETVETPEAPQETPMARIEPKELQEWTINEFFKQYNELVRQGYPPDLCTKVAKAHVLGLEMIIDVRKDVDTK